MTEIRVLLADDHKTVRDGLKLIINSEPDMTVIGEAGNGHDAIRKAIDLQPDVFVTDISMPEMSGLVAAATLKRMSPSIKILALTRHTDKAYLQELLQAGVSGYVLKQSESFEMLRAIRIVAKGGDYLDPAITGDIFDIISAISNKPNTARLATILNERESDVLRRIARGYSNKEIAGQLDSNVKTIESQKASALRKLNIKGRSEIVDYAILQGWLSTD